MKWNVEKIAFLYPPDVFTGAFDNDKMQARHEQQMQQKLEALKNDIAAEKDPLLAMNKLHKKDHMQFLLNNKLAFHNAARFEESVLALYSKQNAPFSSGGDSALWNSLFEVCDGQRLRDLGEPVPFTSAVVYRGSVSGFKKSLSWTPDRTVAQRLAKRWQDPNLGGGEIYEVDIVKSDVLLYRKLKAGDEVLLAPQCIGSAEIRNFNPGI